MEECRRDQLRHFPGAFPQGTVVARRPAASRDRPRGSTTRPRRANLARATAVYAGYARGLEESGTAPPNAANRNQPLTAILTEQKDAGVPLQPTASVKLSPACSTRSRPYFGYDTANIFHQVGTVGSRGAEFSVSGSVTPRLDVRRRRHAPSRPQGDRRARRSPARSAPKPWGSPPTCSSLNANWKTPFVQGLELDLASDPPRARPRNDRQ